MRRFLGVLFVAVGLMAAPASSQAAGLASTPYMGWNPYYGLGGHFDEATVKSVATSLISRGLAGAGYRIVWLDFGWASGARDSSGQLIVDSSLWPDLASGGFTAWLHQQGLQAGIYTDAGRTGCRDIGVGSYGHYQQDADTFAKWGFDAVKVDFCGAGQEIAAGQLSATPQQLYTQFASALANNSSHRPMLLNVDNFWDPGQIDGTNPSLANSSYGNYAWAPSIAQSWRTATDIGFPKNVVFANVLRNLDRDAAHPEAAGPGHWNDPDYLAPELGMTATEAQSQFSMWAMLAAPLIIGSDPRALSADTISMLENPSVIAIDQDSLGAQGTAVQQSGSEQTWSKPLANGDRAVALLNRGTTTLEISTTASAVGLPQAGDYSVQDLWSSATPTTTDALGNLTAQVPPHGVALYRITASGSASPNPGTGVLTTATAGSGMGTVDDGSAIPSCLGTCAHRYQVGTAITLQANPSSGSRFMGWIGSGCSGTGTCTITLDADTDMTAAFAAQQTLKVSLAGDGSGTASDATARLSCPGACSAVYDRGTVVTLTAAASSGSAFVGWSGGGCSGTGACTVTLGANEAVIARFVHLHTLTVSVIGAGGGTVSAPGLSCPGTCSASYPEGTPVTLLATPSGRSELGGWLSGNCSPAISTCRITLSADAGLTVAFDPARWGTAYVVDTGANRVTPIDLATNRAGPRIAGFHRPRAIATSPDGGTAYVVNAGTATVTPINLATNTAEPAITGFRRPGPIATSPHGRSAYVLEDGRRLVAVDLATHLVRTTIHFARGSGVGDVAASIAIAPHGHVAYLGTLTNGTGTVAAVDLATGRVKAVIRGFARPAAIALAPGGQTAYVADSDRGDVVPISLASNRKISAPTLSARGAFPEAAALAITPDGKAAYVAGGSQVYVINLATNTIVRLTGFARARGVAVDPSGTSVWATSSGDGTVIPIDVATESTRPAVTGLSSPQALAVAVPPPHSYSVRIAGHLRRTANAVEGKLKCTSTTTACITTAALIALRRGGIVVLGKARTIVGGRTRKLTIRLDRAARELLARRASVAAMLVLAIDLRGHWETVMTSSITIGQTARRRKQ
jgi:DNA-binding beta-propeller fold protein YncE